MSEYFPEVIAIEIDRLIEIGLIGIGAIVVLLGSPPTTRYNLIIHR